MLRFTLFGIPIGVHLSFLLIVVLGPRDSAQAALLWVVAAFVAIILHELGHALTARRFGASDVNITVYGLGGLTSFVHRQPVSHGRSFLISAAGSAAGIAVGLALVGLAWMGVFTSWPDLIIDFLDYFVFVALVWGVLNWIPIVPLDGGHMMQHFIAIFNEKRAPLIAQIVTWVSVGVIVPLAVVNGFIFGAVIVVIFALAGLREFRQGSARPSKPEMTAVEPGDVDPVEPAPPSEPPPAFPI